MVAPEQVIRLAELRERFEAARARSARPSQPRLPDITDDPELDKWAREIDEEQRRWKDRHEPKPEDEDDDDGPRSSSRAA
jgi:hypothetical protein